MEGADGRQTQAGVLSRIVLRTKCVSSYSAPSASVSDPLVLPDYRGSPIFLKKNHNPLSLRTNLVLNNTTTTASPLRDISDDLAAADILLRETMPAYSAVGEYLFEVLKLEINSSNNHHSELLSRHGFMDGNQIGTTFLMQFLNYTRGKYPFNLYTNLNPRRYWTKLKDHSESVLLAVRTCSLQTYNLIHGSPLYNRF